MTDKTLACPECDSAHIVVRSGERGRWYRCSDCGVTTNAPVRRERKPHGTNLSGQGMVGRLKRADPDDVTAD